MTTAENSLPSFSSANNDSLRNIIIAKFKETQIEPTDLTHIVCKLVDTDSEMQMYHAQAEAKEKHMTSYYSHIQKFLQSYFTIILSWASSRRKKDQEDYGSRFNFDDDNDDSPDIIEQPPSQHCPSPILSPIVEDNNAQNNICSED